MSRSITVRFAVPGFHCWPEAPPHRIYLAAKHRHLFRVSVSMPVRHDDREVEFHDLRDEAEALLQGIAEDGSDFGRQSCEDIARRLATVLGDAYDRPVTVTVSEDGEFDATVSLPA